VEAMAHQEFNGVFQAHPLIMVVVVVAMQVQA
jgi:hypothetical protein